MHISILYELLMQSVFIRCMAPHSNDTTTMLFNIKNNNNNDPRTRQKLRRSARLQYVSGAILMAWPFHITSIKHNGLYTSESYILHIWDVRFYPAFLLCLLFVQASSSQDIHSDGAMRFIWFSPLFITHFVSFSRHVYATPCIHQMDTHMQNTLSYE